MFGIESSSFRKCNPQLCLFHERKERRGLLLAHKVQVHLLACHQTSWSYSLHSRYDWRRGQVKQTPSYVMQRGRSLPVSDLPPWHSWEQMWHNLFMAPSPSVTSHRFRERHTGNCNRSPLSAGLRGRGNVQKSSVLFSPMPHPFLPLPEHPHIPTLAFYHS